MGVCGGGRGHGGGHSDTPFFAKLLQKVHKTGLNIQTKIFGAANHPQNLDSLLHLNSTLNRTKTEADSWGCVEGGRSHTPLFCQIIIKSALNWLEYGFGHTKLGQKYYMVRKN